MVARSAYAAEGHHILEMLEIIDFHVHPFIEYEGYRGYYPLSYPLQDNSMEDELTQFGIGLYCGSVITIPAKEIPIQQLIRICNRQALRIRTQSNGRFIPGIQVSPVCVDESVVEMQIAKENDIRLLGELVPAFFGWQNYDCPGFRDILDASRQFHMVVHLHTETHLLDQMETLAADYPDITFVFAHPGEKDRLLRHIEIMKQHENVHLDLSGTGILRYGMLRHLVNQVGAERVLFGSDYPICNPNCYIAGVLSERLTDEERELIFAKNAKRLLEMM